MTTPDRIRLDPQTLRGVAHPLRVRLLGLLRQDGPSTASRLAERTGQSSGATSYHLRQLASYGFVVEEPALGAGRERWWRAVHRSSTMEAADVRSAPVEAEAYMRAVASEYADRVERWVGDLPALPTEWDQGATLSDWRLRLTADEAHRLLADLEAVIRSYRTDEPDGERPEGTERVILQLQLMPFLATAAPGSQKPESQKPGS